MLQMNNGGKVSRVVEWEEFRSKMQNSCFRGHQPMKKMKTKSAARIDVNGRSNLGSKTSILTKLRLLVTSLWYQSIDYLNLFLSLSYSPGSPADYAHTHLFYV